jgi:hypothetical protein
MPKRRCCQDIKKGLLEALVATTVAFIPHLRNLPSEIKLAQLEVKLRQRYARLPEGLDELSLSQPLDIRELLVKAMSVNDLREHPENLVIKIIVYQRVVRSSLYLPFKFTVLNLYFLQCPI